MDELKIEYIEIDKLTPYKDNTKIHTAKQIGHIANSINARAIEFFYEMPARYSIKEIFYYEVKDNFTKHYGYFRITR